MNLFPFLLAGVLQGAEPGPAPQLRFSDDFSIYPAGRCLREGSGFGPWSVVFNGFGCAQVERGEGGAWLRVDSARSLRASETHAVFVAGPAFRAPLTFEARVKTVRQLRAGSPANPWEVGWLVWGYLDNDHFYYFVPRTNGWELGKRDPAYPKGQRTLASGARPSFALGSWTRIRVAHDGRNRISVAADGRSVASFVDEERPYVLGRVGFYDEDSRACIADIGVTSDTP